MSPQTLRQYFDPRSHAATSVNPPIVSNQPPHNMYTTHGLPLTRPAHPLSYYSLPELSHPPPQEPTQYLIPTDEQWNRWVAEAEKKYITTYWKTHPGLCKSRQSTADLEIARKALRHSMDLLPPGKLSKLIQLFMCSKLDTGSRWAERPSMSNDLLKICTKVNKINYANADYIRDNITTLFPSITPTDIKIGTPQWHAGVRHGAALLNVNESYLHTQVGDIIVSLTKFSLQTSRHLMDSPCVFRTLGTSRVLSLSYLATPMRWVSRIRRVSLTLPISPSHIQQS